MMNGMSACPSPQDLIAQRRAQVSGLAQAGLVGGGEALHHRRMRGQAQVAEGGRQDEHQQQCAQAGAHQQHRTPKRAMAFRRDRRRGGRAHSGLELEAAEQAEPPLGQPSHGYCQEGRPLIRDKGQRPASRHGHHQDQDQHAQHDAGEGDGM